MKVLLTGGAGFIGSHVVDAYIDKGYDVVIADNLSSGKKDNVNPKARFYYCDITRLDILKLLFKKERPDIVNHHAAQINVRHSVTHPQDDATINILGSLNLLECCKEFNIKKFVYASSCGVYGLSKKLPYGEHTPITPLSQYGVSKHTVEHYIQVYSYLYGFDYAILRYGNVYGPRQNCFGEAGVAAIFSNQLLNRKIPSINGDGEQTRDFIFVGDAAEANVCATESESKHKIFNIGTGKETTINKLYMQLAKITQSTFKAEHKNAIQGEIKRIYLDSSLAIKELKWRPKTSLKQGLIKTVNWFKST